MNEISKMSAYYILCRIFKKDCGDLKNILFIMKSKAFSTIMMKLDLFESISICAISIESDELLIKAATL